MRVFVLSTGRAGSTTFAEACQHLTNYSAAHESLASRRVSERRFAYPDNHIESDNRLSWFLGELGYRFDGEDTLYVHLTRDEEAVALSHLRRWDNPTRGSIIRAFAHGVLMTDRDWPESERLEICRFYARTVNANITEFIRSRPSMTVSVENCPQDFRLFLDRISAEGNIPSALSEWDTKHNA